MSVAGLWRRPGVRAAVWQILVAALIGTALLWIVGNIAINLPRLKMDLRFGFLAETASFELGGNLVGYSAGDTYAKAFLAGITNTLQVAVIGIILTAVVGTLVALLRLSGNLLMDRLAFVYIEVARNVPLLLQLLFWQTLLIRSLPPPRAAWAPLPGVVVSNRGATFPLLQWQPAYSWSLLCLAIMTVAVWFAFRRSRPALTRVPAAARSALKWVLILLPPLVILSLFANPAFVEIPVLRGFNLVGGTTLVPEFFALLFGLVFCHAGFAAESIRAGIVGVSKGQWNAARSLGLDWWQTMRQVILPQALRIMVPPLTSNFLSLTKSSSLAVAIGYPDLMRVSTVAISETGRAIECITLLLFVYLTLSLVTSALMNLYNHRIAMRGGNAP